MNVPHTLDLALMALNQDKNLIITHSPGRGIFAATTNSIMEVTRKMVIAETPRLELWDLGIFDADAEVLVFTDFERASTPVKAVVRELMEKKVADGVPAMPNLKTVIVLMCVPGERDHLTEDAEAVAQELGRLAPSIVLNIND